MESTGKVTIRPMSVRELVNQIINKKLAEIKQDKDNQNLAKQAKLEADLKALQTLPRVQKLITEYKKLGARRDEIKTVLQGMGLTFDRYGNEKDLPIWTDEAKSHRLGTSPTAAYERSQQVRQLANEAIIDMIGAQPANVRSRLHRLQRETDAV